MIVCLHWHAKKPELLVRAQRWICFILVFVLFSMFDLKEPRAQSDQDIRFNLLDRQQTSHMLSILEAANHGYARIETKAGSVLGSAIIVRPGNLALTSAHAIDKERSIILVSQDHGHFIEAKIGFLDQQLDLALLCLERLLPGNARLSSIPSQQLPVAALGSTIEREKQISLGYLAKRDRAKPSAPPTIDLELQAAQGFSGGPVIASDGRVVGMIIAFKSDPPRARMITSPLLKAFIQQEKHNCREAL